MLTELYFTKDGAGPYIDRALFLYLSRNHYELQHKNDVQMGVRLAGYRCDCVCRLTAISDVDSRLRSNPTVSAMPTTHDLLRLDYEKQGVR